MGDHPTAKTFRLHRVCQQIRPAANRKVEWTWQGSAGIDIGETDAARQATASSSRQCRAAQAWVKPSLTMPLQ